MAAKGTFMTVRGMKETKKNFETLVKRGTATAIRKATNIAKAAMMQNVQYYTPVDTGLLRKSWTVSVSADEKRITLANDTFYAAFVEYGHHTVSGSWVPGVFMMSKAMKNVMPLIESAFERTLEQQINAALNG